MTDKEFLDNEKEVEINLSELFSYFKDNIKIIIISTLICTLLFGVATVFIISKKYESTARIYPKPEVVGGVVEYSQINANNLMVNNYVEMLKGNNIQSQVAKSLNIDVKELSGYVSIKNETNTQIISVTATTKDPQLSKQIVDGLVETFKQEAKNTLNISNITTVDQAEAATDPVSPSLKKNLVIGVFIGAFISLIYLLVKFIMDTHIHNKEEAEKYLGIPMLGSIPWFED